LARDACPSQRGVVCQGDRQPRYGRRERDAPGRAQVCSAVGLCSRSASVAANASAAGAATARKLLTGRAVGGADDGALGDSSPTCQFCTVAISYIKARRPPRCALRRACRQLGRA